MDRLILLALILLLAACGSGAAGGEDVVYLDVGWQFGKDNPAEDDARADDSMTPDDTLIPDDSQVPDDTLVPDDTPIQDDTPPLEDTLIPEDTPPPPDTNFDTGPCGGCPPDYPNCVNGACQCTPFSCVNGTYCKSGQCVPCTVDAHCGPDCVSCPSMGQFCGPDGVTCLDCDDAHPCPSSQSCIDNVCTPCQDLGFCGPDCLTCEGETPDCVGGDCVCNESSCPGEHACDGGDCVPCTDSDPAHCGPDCLTCTGATPHCLDGGCTLCDTEAACGPSCEACTADEHCSDSGCVPNCTAQGCTSDLGPDGKKSSKAKIIGRVAASPGTGPFLTSGDTTDDGDNDNLPSFGVDCWDAQDDNFFRIWLNAGDQVAITADPVDSDFQLSLKLYQGTVCDDKDHLIQCHWDEDDGDAETILHTATSDDWVTIVVDGASGFDDQGDWGSYDLSVTLICTVAGCCCS